MNDAYGGDGTDAPRAEDVDQEERALFWQVPGLRAAAVAGVLLLAGYAAELTGAEPVVVLAVKGLALVIGSYTFVPAALRLLLQGGLGLATLMTIATAGAVALGQIGEAAMLALLFSISEGTGEYFRRRGLRAFRVSEPEQVTVLRDGAETTTARAELQPGDRIVVRPGERIATGGVIWSGQSTLDLSANSGESGSRDVGVGDEVLAGASNGAGVLQIDVTTAAETGALAGTAGEVEFEDSRAAASPDQTDRIAKPVVLAVLLAAVATAGVGGLLGGTAPWGERALVVLVAACPCALAVSIPATVAAAVGAMSRAGLLVKDDAAVAALGRVRGVALYRTSVLTRDRPVVADVVAVDGIAGEHVRRLAAAVGAGNEHPLVRAVRDAAPEDVPESDEVTTTAGAGLVGRVDGHAVRVGRPGWIEASGLDSEVERMRRDGCTVLVVENGEQLIGALGVRDEVRPGAVEAIGTLRSAGYHVAMLTGDSRTTADVWADVVGIDTVHAELGPEDKARIIGELGEDRRTALVGDGVRDAPVLATADVGIALRAADAEMPSNSTAHVTISGEDPRDLPNALAHARRARRITRENIALSMTSTIGLVPLAVLGMLSLTTVVLVHGIAGVVVIANSIRAGRDARRQPPAGPTQREPNSTVGSAA